MVINSFTIRNRMQYYVKTLIIVFKVNEDTKFVVDIRYMFDFN